MFYVSASCPFGIYAAWQTATPLINNPVPVVTVSDVLTAPTRSTNVRELESLLQAINERNDYWITTEFTTHATRLATGQAAKMIYKNVLEP